MRADSSLAFFRKHRQVLSQREHQTRSATPTIHLGLDVVDRQQVGLKMHEVRQPKRLMIVDLAILQGD